MRDLHPYTKLALVFAISGFSVLLDGVRAISVLAAFSVTAFLLSRPSPRTLKTYLIFTGATVWGLTISQGFFYQDYPRTVLWCLIPPGKYFSGLCLIREGLSYGALQSLRMVAGLSAGLYLVTTTPVEMLMRALATLPAPRGLTLLAASAVRFLPRVSEDLHLVRQALRLRGYRFDLRHPLRSIAVELSMVKPLLTRSVKESRRLAEALLLRGFDPLSPMPVRKFPPWPRREKILTILILGLTLVVLILKILFWLYLQDILYLERLRPLYALVRVYL
ncbi:energy-coupling factor transporter transmembrane component T [Thermosulfurimonas sp. F29]|uniref:energy-coupling factor transporter transmembrane component T n=1 Tax=Thermosulfurimonas sp. F29 TaxID=2867247 RepID=UPI001C82F15F|nr:energy-coupling factor transporter transmembrane component T [Thermosulfurimonas sp. F29]MBX6423499.1 energy-coupling factor transporter transmembrane protein EcfT [Thermosulfurimonas sp. F29]